MNDCGLCERALLGEHATHYLCPGCTRATGERLDRLPKLHKALAVFLVPAGRRLEHVSTRGAEAPLPVNEHVLDLRGPGGIVGVLEDWRAALHNDLAWSPPAISGSTEDRIDKAVRGLLDNLLWIATSWPMAGAFAEELRDLEAAALSIADPPQKTYRLGTCPQLNAHGTTCGAILRVTATSTEARCPWCQTVWPPDTWLALRAAQHEGEPA